MRQTDESIADKLTVKAPAMTADALAKTIPHTHKKKVLAPPQVFSKPSVPPFGVLLMVGR